MTDRPGAEAAAIDALLAAARKDVDDGWLPACQLAVARNGELLVFETFGAATDADRFLGFSVTKPIVAACVWQLISEGALDVSRPVAHYIEEFGSNGKDAVTVEQVMLHTSGFPSARIHPVAGADPVRRVARLAEWSLEWEPGTRFEYHAESAHWVLAELIERLTGHDFRDEVHARVTAPLALPRLLGLAPDAQDHIAHPVAVGSATGGPQLPAEMMASPDVIAAGVPGGGGVMTAADLAGFYQGLLNNPGELWDPALLADVTGTIRCTLPEPLFGIAANRSLGLVIAGDDGMHVMRYAAFGQSCSPQSFGHAGMHAQVGWADPATGVSFAYLTNGADTDVMREGGRGVTLSDLAAKVGLA